MRMARNISYVGALGALGFLAACGDAVPPAAQGGVSVHFSDPTMDHPTDRCSAGRHWANVPHDISRNPNPQAQQVSSSDTGPKGINGQAGVSIKCTVKPNGAKFSFSASTSSAAGDVAPTIIEIGVKNGIADGDSNAVGYVSVQDNQTVTSYSSQDCIFSVRPTKDGDGMGIEAGRIWGSISCGQLQDPKTPGAGCSVDSAYFVFENCAQ